MLKSVVGLTVGFVLRHRSRAVVHHIGELIDHASVQGIQDIAPKLGRFAFRVGLIKMVIMLAHLYLFFCEVDHRVQTYKFYVRPQVFVGQETVVDDRRRKA